MSKTGTRTARVVSKVSVGVGRAEGAREVLLRVRLGLVSAAGVAALAGLVLLTLIALRREDPDPADYPLRGIDVSHHQGPIDWAEVAADEVDFAFIKATEGGDFHDPRFEMNWRASRENGIARGAYHYFTFCTPGRTQAAHFLTVVPPEAGALAPAIDVEFSGNCTGYGEVEEIRRELAVLLREVERAWQRKPLLYLTTRSRIQLMDSRFADYPIWQRNVFWRMPPDPAPAWSVWQYADDGEVAGIQGPVDRNVLHPSVDLESLTAVGVGTSAAGAPVRRPEPSSSLGAAVPAETLSR